MNHWLVWVATGLLGVLLYASLAGKLNGPTVFRAAQAINIRGGR
jgi:hypothetical protein